jgi:hypothetical protein
VLGQEDIAEVQGDADWLLTSVGLDPAEPPDLWELCQRLLGTAPRAAPHLATESELARLRGWWRVLWRRGLPPPRARWRVAHELAEWHYRGRKRDRIEEWANALGASLVAPPAAVRAHGPDPHQLAVTLGITQSLALLRIGEVYGTPVVLIRRGEAPLYRGDPWCWPPDLATVPWPCHTVWITDEPARVGLVAEW